MNLNFDSAYGSCEYWRENTIVFLFSKQLINHSVENYFFQWIMAQVSALLSWLVVRQNPGAAYYPTRVFDL